MTVPREEPLIIMIDPGDEEPTPYDTGYRAEINDSGHCILHFPSAREAAYHLQLLADYFRRAAERE